MLISEYITPTGETALAITKHGDRYSYTGKYGAGSGHTLDDLIKMLKTTKQAHKRMKHHSGIDLIN